MLTATNQNIALTTLALGHTQHQHQAAASLTRRDGEKVGYISAISDLVKDIQRRSHDNLVPVRDLVVDPAGSNGLQLAVTGSSDLALFSNLSLGQLCGALGIPSSYIRRCLEFGEAELAAENLRFWLKKLDPNKQMLLRMTADDSAPEFLPTDRLHGILSSRYVCFDDPEVVALTDDILGEQGGYTVQNYCVTPDQLRLRLISDKRLDLGDDNGGLFLGLDIGNSRVGLASFSVNVILYRSACMNGMIFGAQESQYFRRRHTKTFGTEIRSSFTEVLSQLPDFMDYCRRAVSESRLTQLKAEDITNLLNKFRVEAINSTAVVAKIQEMIERYTEPSGQVYTWGLINAITEVAQNYHLEQRDRMEKFAGSLLIR